MYTGQRIYPLPLKPKLASPIYENPNTLKYLSTGVLACCSGMQVHLLKYRERTQIAYISIEWTRFLSMMIIKMQAARCCCSTVTISDSFCNKGVIVCGVVQCDAEDTFFNPIKVDYTLELQPNAHAGMTTWNIYKIQHDSVAFKLFIQPMSGYNHEGQLQWGCPHISSA